MATPSRRELVTDFYETMLGLQRMIGPSHDDFLKGYGLTGAQVQLLYFLDRTSPCNVKDVAGCMCTTSGAATQLIEGLVQGGLIDRTSSESDRRYVEVAITERGQAFFKKFKVAHAKHLETILAPLTDEDLAYSNRIRETVKEHMLATKPAARN